MARDLGSKIQANLALRSPLSSRSEKRLDPEAYETYLQARHFLAKRDAEAMKRALGYFQQVVQRDPEYAPAYAGLAISRDLLGTFEVLPPQETLPKAKSLASRALQLDNTLAEAYTARAMTASFWEFNWSAADQDFRRAIELDPSSPLAHAWYAEHWINIGKAEQAITEMKRAHESDPLSLFINAALGTVYRDAHRYKEALQQCTKTVDLDRHFARGHWCLSQVYIGQHRYAAAIQELETAKMLGTTPLILRDLAWVHAAAGNTSIAKAILDELMRPRGSDYIHLIPLLLYTALGEKVRPSGGWKMPMSNVIARILI